MIQKDNKVLLTDGSEVDRGLFDNLEQSLKDDGPDEFVENRIARRQDSDPTTPFNARSTGTLESVAKTRHEERTERAQSVDEHYNAPIAPNYETWANNKDRYDLPGVDTIPKDELTRRGNEFLGRAQDLGAVENVERKTLGGTKKGEFTASPKNSGNPLTGETGYATKVQANEDLDEADYPAFGEGAVLAHETGHAVDFEAGGSGRDFLSQGGFFARNDGDLFGEAIQLSKRVRGDYNSRQAGYREDDRELIADSLAAVALEPQAARREAPNLVPALEDEVGRKVGDENESVFDF